MQPGQLRKIVLRYGAAGVAFVGAVLLLRAVWRRGRLGLAAFGMAALIFALCWRQETPELRVTFLDVGKGDAIVIEAPSGQTMVVDAGGWLRNGSDYGREVIAPYLRRRGVERIEMLLLTHPHGDHIGGAVSLLELFPVGVVRDNGEKVDSEIVQRYRSAAKQRGVPCESMRKGEEITLGRGVSARVVAPAEALRGGRTNNTSLVLRLTYGQTALLLTGDAEAESEEAMRQGGETLASDVLKVAHHGSPRATTAEFLKAVRPRYAIISVDADNANGYPAPEVLERLRAVGAQIYRTDRHGTITYIYTGNTLRVETAPR
jgi:competence protein ComEC